MADGTRVPIESVRAGDLVLAADPATGRWRAREVVSHWSHLDDGQMATVTLEDGTALTATDHHRFWVESSGRWRELADVRPGDLLLTPHGVTAVAGVEVTPPTRTLVWELDTAVDDTFAVFSGSADVLVHNADCFSNDKETRRTRPLTDEELNHAFDRHAAEVLNKPSVTRTEDFDAFRSVVEQARTSGLTFENRRGGTDTFAHLARVTIDGEQVYVVVDFRQSDGMLSTVTRPSPAQLSRYLEIASRQGP
jgi:intein/homing endonuclease